MKNTDTCISFFLPNTEISLVSLETNVSAELLLTTCSGSAFHSVVVCGENEELNVSLWNLHSFKCLLCFLLVGLMSENDRNRLLFPFHSIFKSWNRNLRRRSLARLLVALDHRPNTPKTVHEVLRK